MRTNDDVLVEIVPRFLPYARPSIRRGLLAAAGLFGFACGWFVYADEAWASTCYQDICLCGEADKDANGRPQLPQDSWNADCSALQMNCAQGGFTCTHQCVDGSCCGGECED